MRKFLRSNTFLIILSVTCAVLLWIYVAYEVNPTYKMTIKNIPLEAVNVPSAFDSGDMIIDGENKTILTKQYTIDIEVEGKRNIVSSIKKSDISCTLDMYTVDKAGKHSLKPVVDIRKSGVKLVDGSVSAISFDVENIKTRNLTLKLKSTGELPEGYTLNNVSYNDTIAITGTEDNINNVGSAYISLNYSDLSPDDSEKELEIIYLDKDGKVLENSSFTSTTKKSEKVKFNLYTKKEVTLVLRPYYKDNKKTNNNGKNVFLSVEDSTKKVNVTGGVEIKVTLEGTKKALEKYTNNHVVYTEPVDVSEIYYDTLLPDKYKAASLERNVRYVSVPEVAIKATILSDEASSALDNSVMMQNSIGEELTDE